MTAKNIMVQPTKPRHTLEDTGEGLRIVIPTREKWYFINPKIIALVGTLILIKTLLDAFIFHPYESVTPLGEYIVIFNTIPNEIKGVLALFGVMAISFVLVISWHIFGREVIEVSSQALICKRELFSVGNPKKYSAKNIKDMRISPFQSRSFIQVGPLAFDYGAKTIRIGGGIDEAEAKQILAAIVARFPQYAAEGAAG
ncbi:MAG: hypothetical protein OEZ02_12300 [Anaerolineae bacterium]|nr:hypothetical protein [Anaerolineae bacterium]